MKYPHSKESFAFCIKFLKVILFDCLQVNQIWWLRKWGQIVAFKMSGMKNCVLIKQLNIYRKADLIFGIKKIKVEWTTLLHPFPGGISSFLDRRVTAAVMKWVMIETHVGSWERWRKRWISSKRGLRKALKAKTIPDSRITAALKCLEA